MPGSAKMQDPANWDQPKDSMPHRSERPWAYRILEKRDTATAISPRSSTRRDSVCTGSIQRRRTAVAKKSIVLSDSTDPSTHGISQAAEPHQCWIARPDPIGRAGENRMALISRRAGHREGLSDSTAVLFLRSEGQEILRQTLEQQRHIDHLVNQTNQL